MEKQSNMTNDISKYLRKNAETQYTPGTISMSWDLHDGYAHSEDLSQEEVKMATLAAQKISL